MFFLFVSVLYVSHWLYVNHWSYACMHACCLFMLFYVNICYALLFENKDKIKTICLLQTKQLSDKFCLLIKPKITHPPHRERKFAII